MKLRRLFFWSLSLSKLECVMLWAWWSKLLICHRSSKVCTQSSSSAFHPLLAFVEAWIRKWVLIIGLLKKKIYSYSSRSFHCGAYRLRMRMTHFKIFKAVSFVSEQILYQFTLAGTVLQYRFLLVFSTQFVHLVVTWKQKSLWSGSFIWMK